MTLVMPMMEIPEANKPDAGNGCFMAAGLYAVTFLISLQSIKGGKKAA